MEAFIHFITSKYFIFSVLVVVITVAVLIGLKKLKKSYIKKAKIDNRTSRATYVSVISEIIRIIIIVLAIILVLQINGVNVTSLVAGLGIAGAIAGLAVQDLLKDIVMGMRIMGDHFYNIGDCVEFNGYEGKVVFVNAKTTKIEMSDDHSIISVCNRDITQVKVISHYNNLDIPLPYGENDEKIKEVFEDISKKISDINGVEKCEYLGIQSFENSDILHRLRYYCDPFIRYEIKRKSYDVVRQTLNDENIHVPFNQLDVHFDK